MEKPYNLPLTTQELFGYALHHALLARFCIERGRFSQAEYWISGVFRHALVRSLEQDKLMRALRCTIDGLLG